MSDKIEPTDQAVIEDRSVKLLVAGPCTAAALRAGRIHWFHAQDGDRNQWREVIALPHGVNAKDIAALSCDSSGISLVTRAGGFYVWRQRPPEWSWFGSVIDAGGTR